MNRITANITDYDIQALIDNELNHEEAKKVRTSITNSSILLDRYNGLLKQKHILQSWWKSKSH